MLVNTTDLFCNYEYKSCQNEHAETIILVHGLGLDMTVWDDIVPLLQKQFHVLRYDLPGHGKSPYDLEEPISWEFLLNNLEKLLDLLSISTFHFIGHSGGGNFGIEVALRMKDLLLSLTLVSTPIFIPKEIGKEEMENRLSKLRSNNIKEITDTLVQNLCFPSLEGKIEKLLKMYRQISISNYKGYVQLVGESLLAYSLECIQQIETPMMMLIGEQDVLYPPQLQMLNMGYMKNSRFLIIPDSSNVIMMDQPETFVKTIVQFIEKTNNKTRQDHHEYNYSKALSEELKSIVETGIQKSDTQHAIRINMVDTFKVAINGHEVNGKWNQRKAKQLFAYLALNKNVTRETLFDTFWPEHDISKARNHLRVSLNHIKGIIEDHTGERIENYVAIERESIEIKAQVKMDLSDLIEFLDSIEREKRPAEEIPSILDQLKSLPETLFPSFYDDWIFELRTSLEDRILSVCENMLDDGISDEHAIELLKILIKYNPVEDLYYEQLQIVVTESGKRK